MKYIFTQQKELARKLNSPDFILLLDFDLTLSPLAKNPANAILPDDTRILLKKLSNYIYIAIITGRTINDIKKRIKLNDLSFIGKHGLEYEVKGTTKNTSLSALSKQ